MEHESPLKPDRGTISVPERAAPQPVSSGSWERFSRAALTRQMLLAFAIAGVSDLLSVFVGFVPPLQWGVDVMTAVLLFMVLGWRWLLLPGLILEAIPGLDVFPFWLLVVGAIAIWGTARPRLPKKG